MVLPSPSQNTMRWFKALNIPYSQHNLHMHDDKWWNHKNSNEGEKTLYFDKEQLYRNFFIIFQDPIVGNGQKSRMLSCEPMNVSTNKWAQANFFRNNLMESFWHVGWNIWWCGGVFCHMAVDGRYFWIIKWMNFYKIWMPNL
jgi:hypothetical protein